MSPSGRSMNRILSLLPPEDYERVASRMERVRIPLGQVVCEPDEPVAFCYFPLTNVLSSVIELNDGSAVEVAVIGNEGLAGVGLLVDERSNPHRLVQQVEGESLRMPADAFRQALDESPALRRVTERYVLTLLRQAGQNAACNRHHTVEERMCRWLLATADRVERDEFYITQEFLGEMLGVRRQSVNLAAGLLQQAGLITYRRGNLRILDRGGLERAACECYRVTNEAYERLMRVPGNGG
ncbi:MAG TPA: Crp/Fnr family transcriptional regulator [Planctomycetaceae bacterium]